MPLTDVVPEKELSLTTVLMRGLLAGAVAGLMETTASALSGSNAGFGLALTHLAALLGVGLAFGFVSAMWGTEYRAARLWLVVPSLVALTPMLTRRFGSAMAITTWIVAFAGVFFARQFCRESVIAGALAGSLMGSRWGHFFAKDYAGRDTAPSALAAVALAVLLAAALYAIPARRGKGRVLANPLPVGGLLLLVSAALVSITTSGTAALPQRIDAAASAEIKPPIVVIVLDTVRADHLAMYGYGHNTMPELETFARTEAVAVNRAIANAPNSLASHASLFTGLFSINHGAHMPLLVDTTTSLGYPLRADVPTLASVLRDDGYATLAVIANHGVVSREIGFGLERGFDVYRSHPRGDCAFIRASPWRPLAQWVGTLLGKDIWMAPCSHRYRRAAEITDEAIALVNATDTSNFLLFVNYMDAHAPYVPPPEFRNRFPGYDPAIIGEMADGTYLRDTTFPGRLRAHEVSQYDAELAYLDTQLARFLRRLHEHPSWDDMLLVITADHGEAFGEHNLRGHSTSLYDVMIRVPLIIKFGRGSADVPTPGSRWERPFQLVDIMPTILAAAGVAIPPGLDGRPAAEVSTPLRSWAFPSRQKMRSSGDRFAELRSIEIDGWKLIEHHTGEVELYELSTDPGEVVNRAGTQPERVALMLGNLGLWASYRSENRPGGQRMSDEALERLRSLGYIR